MDLSFDNPTAFPGYIGAPAPRLQTIVVRKSLTPHPNIEPFEFLGRHTADLRLVHLFGGSINLSGYHFTRLTRLILKSVVNHGMSGSQLFDVFRASPDLEVLELGDISFDIPPPSFDTPPPSSITTLHSLKYIGLKYCDVDLVVWILRQIRAPSCTTLRLVVGDEDDGTALMDESLTPFYETLLQLHKQFGGSEILLGGDEFLWRTSEYFDYEIGRDLYSDEELRFGTQEGPDADTDEGLGFNLLYYPFYPPWVDRILQDEPGLRIAFADEHVPKSIAPMRSVTEAVIEGGWDREVVCNIFRFFGQPLPNAISLPSLPCLQELQIDLGSWHTQDLLDMVRTRFTALSWDIMERTPLTITVSCGYWMYKRRLNILDLATLTEIRRTLGVESIRFERDKYPSRMLAVTWNEGLSKPVWC